MDNVPSFLADFRLSKRAVCEMSKGRGLSDGYHDYPDPKDKELWHFVILTCERCETVQQPCFAAPRAADSVVR